MSSSRLSRQTQWMGRLVAFAGVIFQTVWLGLPAVALSLALLISLGMWLGGGWRIHPGLSRVFGLALVIFLCHVAEEYLTGFQAALPALFGQARWSDGRYLAFNAVWALAFLIALIGLRYGRPLAVFVVCFFAVGGGVGNGIAHLLLALARGGYFPGTWTALACLGVGVWLLWLLYAPNSEYRKSGG